MLAATLYGKGGKTIVLSFAFNLVALRCLLESDYLQGIDIIKDENKKGDPQGSPFLL